MKQVQSANIEDALAKDSCRVLFLRHGFVKHATFQPGTRTPNALALGNGKKNVSVPGSSSGTPWETVTPHASYGVGDGVTYGFARATAHARPRVAHASLQFARHREELAQQRREEEDISQSQFALHANSCWHGDGVDGVFPTIWARFNLVAPSHPLSFHPHSFLAF